MVEIPKDAIVDIIGLVGYVVFLIIDLNGEEENFSNNHYNCIFIFNFIIMVFRIDFK